MWPVFIGLVANVSYMVEKLHPKATCVYCIVITSLAAGSLGVSDRQSESVSESEHEITHYQK